jgi:hypothetical protein
MDRAMAIGAAEIVLGYFGFDKTVYEDRGNMMTRNILKLL